MPTSSVRIGAADVTGGSSSTELVAGPCVLQAAQSTTSVIPPTNRSMWPATRPQQWLPNTIGRYRNCDPVLTNYMVRLGVEGRGGEYHSFPQRELFDKIGIRDMVLETGQYGNFLIQGYEFGSGRDWTRLGNLYLQDGVGGGERILAEGFVGFVSTPAPAWVADSRPIYGGLFWINSTGAYPIPNGDY